MHSGGKVKNCFALRGNVKTVVGLAKNMKLGL